MEFVDLKAQYRHIGTRVDARIRRVLEHQRFILGPEVAELEERLAARVEARHCISCASGTDALLLALLALGIGPGRRSPHHPFTFFATGEMITLAGARPIFIDIEPAAYNLDPEKIEAAITPAPEPFSPSVSTASHRRWTPSTPSQKNMASPSSKTRRRVLAPSIVAATPATSAPSAAPAFFRQSRSAAMAMAARASPTTMPSPKPCASSATMGSPPAIVTRASASTDVSTPCRPRCSWPSSKFSTRS